MYGETRHVCHEDPALTTPAFRRLLEWLDDGVDSDGQTYLEVRRRLVAYFGRRNRPRAEDLADEVGHHDKRAVHSRQPYPRGS